MDDLDRSKSALAASLTPLAAGQVIAAPAAADVQGDTITGSGGPDLIVGGPGADLVYAMGGLASVDGGAGVDTLSFEQFAGPVTAHFADDAATGLAFVSRFEIVIGSALGDTLVGGGGMLTISGGAGADLLTAAADTRQINGDDGADTLQGSGVAVTLFGGDGDDRITGGTGFNQVNGNKGDDFIVGHSLVGDWLLGGQGQDSIDASASSGNNIVNGNIGADTLVGGPGNDTLRGGQGDDVIRVGGGDNWISGDLGTNTIYGGQGQDTIRASAGHDVVNGWHAGDHVLVAAGVTHALSQVGADLHIVFSNGGQIDLIGVQQSSLQSDWLISS